MEVVASLSQGRTAAVQCGLFTHKSVPVIFEPPCIYSVYVCICRTVEGLSTPAAGLAYPEFVWCVIMCVMSVLMCGTDIELELKEKDKTF